MAIFNSYVKLPEGNPTIEHKYEVHQMISDQNRRNRLSISCWALPLSSALRVLEQWCPWRKETNASLANPWPCHFLAISCSMGSVPPLILNHPVEKSTAYPWLVGGFNHLEKYESQWEGWHPIYEMENNPAMFQTTNKMIKSNCLSAVSFLTFFAPHVSSSKVCRAFNGSSVYFQLE